MHRWVVRVVEAAMWCGLCLGIWLITLSAVSTQELVVAVLVSLPCGVLAVAGRVATQRAWHLRPAWLVPIVVLPVAIVSDTVQVLGSAVLRRSGRFEIIPVDGGRGRGPKVEARRAIAAFWVTVTPGSFVVDIDPETGDALVHVLAERGPSIQRLATR